MSQIYPLPKHWNDEAKQYFNRNRVALIMYGYDPVHLLEQEASGMYTPLHCMITGLYTACNLIGENSKEYVRKYIKKKLKYRVTHPEVDVTNMSFEQIKAVVKVAIIQDVCRAKPNEIVLMTKCKVCKGTGFITAFEENGQYFSSSCDYCSGQRHITRTVPFHPDMPLHLASYVKLAKLSTRKEAQTLRELCQRDWKITQPEFNFLINFYKYI